MKAIVVGAGAGGLVAAWELARAGIPAMPLKGLAVAPLYYGGFAFRPMSDFDLLVPTASAGEAARILVDAGWHSPYQQFLGTEAYWSTRYSAQFHSADGDEFDLHWHLLPQGSWPQSAIYCGPEKYPSFILCFLLPARGRYLRFGRKV